MDKTRDTIVMETAHASKLNLSSSQWFQYTKQINHTCTQMKCVKCCHIQKANGLWHQVHWTGIFDYAAFYSTYRNKTWGTDEAAL